MSDYKTVNEASYSPLPDHDSSLLSPPRTERSATSTSKKKPPNPMRNKKRAVAICAFIILALTVWASFAAYQVIKHLVQGPDIPERPERKGDMIDIDRSAEVPFEEMKWVEGGDWNDEGGGNGTRQQRSEGLVCFMRATERRKKQVSSSYNSWMRECNFSVLISTSTIPSSLVQYPHISIEERDLERCIDRLVFYVADTRLDEAQWMYLADDESFVLVKHLKVWLDRSFDMSQPIFIDLSKSRTHPSFIANAPAMRLLRELNVTTCESQGSQSLAQIIKDSSNALTLPVDHSSRPIIVDMADLRKYDGFQEGALYYQLFTPSLSIIRSVSANEMYLLKYLTTNRQ